MARITDKIEIYLLEIDLSGEVVSDLLMEDAKLMS